MFESRKTMDKMVKLTQCKNMEATVKRLNVICKLNVRQEVLNIST